MTSLPKVRTARSTTTAWTTRIANLSSVFSAYPEVLSSGVEFQVIDGITELVNSEGTELRYHDTVNWLYGEGGGTGAGRDAGARCRVHSNPSIPHKLPSDAEMRQVACRRRRTCARPGEGADGRRIFRAHAV